LGILIAVDPHGLDYARRPLNDKAFESISLIKEGEHVLLHGLSRLLTRLALIIILVLRIDDLDDQLLCLAQRVQLHRVLVMVLARGAL